MSKRARAPELTSDPGFNLAIDHAHGTATITCSGCWDDGSWAQLAEAIDLVLEGSPQRLVLDVREVDAKSSPSRVLARAAELCRRHEIPLQIAPGAGVAHWIEADGWNDLLERLGAVVAHREAS